MQRGVTALALRAADPTTITTTRVHSVVPILSAHHAHGSLSKPQQMGLSHTRISGQ